MKIRAKILVTVLCLMIVAGMMGGCAKTFIGYYYYYPDWTPDGKIICIKNKHQTSGGGGGFWSPAPENQNWYYITIMDVSGDNERDIKEIEQIGKVAASPLGNYIAYSDGNYIRVITTSGATVSDMDCGANVGSLDWGPDENNLVFSTKTSSTSEIYVVDRAGTASYLLTKGENVAWQYGDHIAFENSTLEGKNLSVIKIDGTSLNVLRIGFYAQKLDANTIIYNHGLQVKQIKVDGTNDTFLFDNFDGYLPKLSRNGDQIVYTNYSDGGIWVINIDGTGLTQVK